MEREWTQAKEIEDTWMKISATFKNKLISISAACAFAAAATMTLASTNSYAATALEAHIQDGLPVPVQSTMQSMEQTPFLVTQQIAVAASIEDVATFYRAELAKLNWQEDKSKEVMNPQGGALQFSSPEGPTILTLVSTGNDTQIKLSLRKIEEARKSGLMPAEGESKVMFGNYSDGQAVVSINDQTVMVAGHVGEEGSVGPSISMKPGTYFYKVEFAGQEPIVAEVVLGPNEIWGLMLDSRGILPLQMY